MSPVATRRFAFASPERVAVTELISEIAAAADALHEAPAVRADYAAFLASQKLVDAPALLRDYLRVRVVFEATRDGGLWGLVWDITNRPGHSDAIWRAWQTARVPAPGTWGVTAIAECDELSALFAFLVRQLGVSHAGFLGGGPMHIVGHWTLRLPHRREVRVVIPTSQVFLSREATLGTRELNAYSAAVVWDYWRKDVPPDHTLPRALAEYLITQLELAKLPAAELQQLRNAHGRS